MIELSVYIEISGKQTFVGKITGHSHNDAVFAYDIDYISRINAAPISVNLPLQSEPFSSAKTGCFFEGLLPEGFIKRSLAQNIHTDENDWTTILAVLGQECLGAVRVAEDNDEIKIGYERLTQQQVKSLAEEGASKSTELVLQSHLSLTGASGKVGLYYDEPNNEWYLPKGLAPSSHIVKQSHIRYKNIIVNEQLSLLTAKKLGIDIADSFIINTGSGTDDDVLFAVKRYDRLINDECHKADGMSVPFRLHQEDFAQVLNVPSANKYEKNGSHYLKLMFDFLLKHSDNPIEDRLKLWNIVIYNYLIGNTDAHLKNYSLCYSADLQTMRLSPAYDIISTRIYNNAAKEMSMSIGGQSLLNRITRSDFENEAKSLGLGTKTAMSAFDRLSAEFQKYLTESAEYLQDLGFDNAITLKDLILE